MKHLPHLSELSVPWGPFPQPQTSRSQSVTKEFQSPAVPASLPPPSPLKSQVNQAASTFYLKCQPGSGFPEKKKIHSQKKNSGLRFYSWAFFSSSPTTTHISLSLYPSPPQTLPYRYPCGHSSSVHSSCSVDTFLFANFTIADISYTTSETPQANNQALLQSKPCVYRLPRFLWIAAARASPERLASLASRNPKKNTLR
ncbi:hypothetical protein CPAR01_05039 [Colletotrichum paranaense]|uniref:Uncharacterized protein n=2 Tax=Colletotrichum acutatum species complex TaxID=2707335 RepID=A0ABQ9SQ71_9PEZI|nr:uncharacterized protein CPAR01_05039 [Colletotrichum paranaense]KAK1541652.1 hypothetical protein CPAR01_05039 [Colletotrichum paranaense]